jgi:hypothetical protein
MKTNANRTASAEPSTHVADFAAKSFIVNCRNYYTSVRQLLNVIRRPRHTHTGEKETNHVFSGELRSAA